MLPLLFILACMRNGDETKSIILIDRGLNRRILTSIVHKMFTLGISQKKCPQYRSTEKCKFGHRSRLYCQQSIFYSAKVVDENIEQKKWGFLERSPYSPYLSSRDFHIFGPLEENLSKNILSIFQAH